MMRALSLHQPWASAVAYELKPDETRGWYTIVRGELAICSTLRRPVADETWSLPSFPRDFRQPRGRVVCVVELYEVVPGLLRLGELNPKQALWGLYVGDRWAWKLRKVRRLERPVPVKGRQGFFWLPADVEKQVREQL